MGYHAGTIELPGSSVIDGYSRCEDQYDTQENIGSSWGKARNSSCVGSL
jgi:hypothetical protein